MVRPMLSHPVLTVAQFWYALGIAIGLLSGLFLGVRIGRATRKVETN